VADRRCRAGGEREEFQRVGSRSVTYTERAAANEKPRPGATVGRGFLETSKQVSVLHAHTYNSTSRCDNSQINTR
jgi:hypothetical protein